MYALIQMRSQPTHRARIIAANNILNALFMVVSSAGRGRAAGARVSPSRRSSWSPALLNAVVGGLHLPAGARVPAAFHRLHPHAACIYRFQRAAVMSTSRCEGAGHPGVQPRQLHRRRGADGGQPAAHPFPHGPPHLRHAGVGLAVPPGQGHPHRAAERRPRGIYERPPSSRRVRVLADGELLAIFPEGGITKRRHAWASSRAA